MFSTPVETHRVSLAGPALSACSSRRSGREGLFRGPACSPAGVDSGTELALRTRSKLPLSGAASPRQNCPRSRSPTAALQSRAWKEVHRRSPRPNATPDPRLPLTLLPHCKAVPNRKSIAGAALREAVSFNVVPSRQTRGERARRDGHFRAGPPRRILCVGSEKTLHPGGFPQTIRELASGMTSVILDA